MGNPPMVLVELLLLEGLLMLHQFGEQFPDLALRGQERFPARGVARYTLRSDFLLRCSE